MTFLVPPGFYGSQPGPPGRSGDGLGCAGEGLGGYLEMKVRQVTDHNEEFHEGLDHNEEFHEGLPHARPLGEGRRTKHNKHTASFRL